MSYILGKRKKTFFGYLVFSGSVLLFGAIYEAFSFGVFSLFMAFAFLIPLLGCPAVLLARFLPETPVGEALFRSALCAATAGSLVRGVLEIYGTTNALWAFYPAAAALFALGSACAYAAAFFRRPRA